MNRKITGGFCKTLVRLKQKCGSGQVAPFGGAAERARMDKETRQLFV